MNLQNPFILGKLSLGIRELRENDLPGLINYLKFSKTGNYCGKIWIVIRLLVTGKGWVSATKIVHLLEKNPSREEIFKKYPHLQTLLKTHQTALTSIIEKSQKIEPLNPKVNQPGPHKLQEIKVHEKAIQPQNSIAREVHIDVNSLTKGYAIIPIDFPEIRNQCLASAKQYFNQSSEKKLDPTYNHPLGEERGYRHLGHKESFLIRDPLLPTELKGCADLATRMHELSLSILQKIEKHLQLKEKTLMSLTHANVWHDEPNKINESVIRVFRYFPVQAEQKDTLPCDAHEDLGLISIILRSTCPSLEVLNFEQMNWINAESAMQEHEAVVLIGESLSSLTNRYFPACTHRVIENEKERYSFVYQLRLRQDAQIDSHDFQTPLNPAENKKHFQTTGKEFFEAIRSTRTSVNKSYTNNKEIK